MQTWKMAHQALRHRLFLALLIMSMASPAPGHGIASAPVEVRPAELPLAFQMQQQATFGNLCVHGSSALLWFRCNAVEILPLGLPACGAGLPRLMGCPQRCCKSAEDFEILHGSHLLPLEHSALHFASALPQACVQAF